MTKDVKKMNRLIAIGDIHGQLEKLCGLLDAVHPGSADRLVFLGDYIDRGPDSAGVIERLIDLQAEFPHTVFLRGNHEQMLIDALIEMGVIQGKRLRDLSSSYSGNAYVSDAKVFMLNGGIATLNSYGIKRLEDGIPPQHLDFIRQTQLWWRNEPFLFVHAGIESGISLEKQDPECLLWARYCEPGSGQEIHVVGHHPTPDRKPLFEVGRYSLDTGAGYGHGLTACDVMTRQVWQVI